MRVFDLYISFRIYFRLKVSLYGSSQVGVVIEGCTISYEYNMLLKLKWSGPIIKNGVIIVEIDFMLVLILYVNLYNETILLLIIEFQSS